MNKNIQVLKKVNTNNFATETKQENNERTTEIKIAHNIPIMLGVKETAEAFGIAQHYARQLALSGSVKAVRVGRGKILINQQSVADFFNSSYINEPEEVANSIQPIPVRL